MCSFKLAFENVGRDLSIETEGTIYNKIFEIPANADDTVLVGKIICMLKEGTVNLNKAVKTVGLAISIQMHERNKK
jgi:hypothetical protein